MRRRSFFRPYIFLALTLTLAFVLPKSAVNPIRSVALASLIPMWKRVDVASSRLYASLFPFRYRQTPNEKESDRQKIEVLQAENRLLHNQITSVREWLFSEEQHTEADRLDKNLRFLPAEVIYREPASWSETVWINVGEVDNVRFSKPLVEVNSPVVCGESIVGVIERVERRRSLVRLITDPTLSVAVRVRRGKEQDRALAIAADRMISQLQYRQGHESELESLKASLEKIKNESDYYLAKGVLHGSSHPLGRHRSSLLKGEGFNYEFADQYGPARDLRSGIPYGEEESAKLLPIVKRGDLLVTSGLDGIFPEGLHVAIVKEQEMLDEGDFSIKLYAVSTLGSLDEITHLQVLSSSSGELSKKSFR
ncbi:MAG: rod shape-determining protein MreC [Simkaniaceae bacterium]|nr:rod shape-determining protein MreC [Simkaniaceae bacterium]